MDRKPSVCALHIRRETGPFQTALKALIDEETANVSPIVESIQAASVNLFLPNSMFRISA